MKKKNLLFLPLFFSFNMVAQSYFNVLTEKVGLDTFYKIALITKTVQEDTVEMPIYWNQSIFFPEIDTIKLIEELFSYEGDERLCLIPVTTYSMEGCSANFYAGTQKRYSLQVEALFIINQIIFKEPCRFLYTNNPVLRNSKTGKTESIKGEIVKEAYKFYKEWFAKAKMYGVSRTIERNILPLDDSNLTWY